MRDHDAESSFLSMRPGRLESLVLLLLVASVALWIAILIPGALLYELFGRVPAAKWKWFMWLGYAMFPAAFFLSGVATMVFARRWLRAARGPTTVLKRVVVLATGCSLLGFLVPFLMLHFFLEGFSVSAVKEQLLSLRAWALMCAMWLCWVAGGLGLSLLKGIGRREPSEHSPSQQRSSQVHL